jgi:aspartate aminotransferase
MLSKKLASVTPSVTIGISTKVNELKKQGAQIINLSIGEPDFFTPEKAKAAGIKAIQDNKTKYDAAAGVKELREAIVEKLKNENGVSYTPDEIVVSSGAKHCITNALIALLDSGDEVLIPKPYWVSYPEIVKILGGTPVFVETQKSNDFKVTVADLEKVITDRTKVIFITNPSNPSGAVYTKEELLPVVNFLTEKGIYIIADEIYERICYNGAFVSIASLSEKAKEMTITINGLAKSASMTGWRIGYTATNLTLAKAMGSIQGHLVSHPCTISQHAAIEAIRSCQYDMEKMVSAYRARKDRAIELFSEIAGVDLVRPDGAFYLFVDMSIIKDKLEWTDSFSVKVCDILLDEYKLAIVPGAAFGLDDYVRLSIAADIKDIEAGIHSIKQLVESYR